jgi:hypothetical protein
MIRCAWCGAKNYSIDMWCARCHRHLEWQPTARVATRRRGIIGLFTAVAAAAVAIALALPAAGWLSGSIKLGSSALPQTGMVPPAPNYQGTTQATASGSPETTATSAAAAPADASTAPTDSGGTVSPPVAIAPPAVYPPAAVNPPQAQQPAPVHSVSADPTAAISQFYSAVTAHQFGTAASLWSARMQSQYPPSVYINRRFSGTQEIGLSSTRILSESDSSAVVYVDVKELIGGQHREWVGTWQLVAGPSGWLLNSPNLRGA